MGLFDVHGMLGSMIADKMNHAMNFARMSKSYGMGRYTMMGSVCVSMKNGRRCC